MLNILPNKRIKPIDALQHPFFNVKIAKQLQPYSLKVLKTAIPLEFYKSISTDEIIKLAQSMQTCIDIPDLSGIEGSISEYDPNDSYKYRLLQSIISETHYCESKLKIRHSESRALSNDAKSSANSNNSVNTSSNRAEDQKGTPGSKATAVHDKAVPPWPTSFGVQCIEYKKRVSRITDWKDVFPKKLKKSYVEKKN